MDNVVVTGPGAIVRRTESIIHGLVTWHFPSSKVAAMSAQPPGKPNRTALPPVTAAVRQRLQAVFEHAQRSAEKADYEYAHDLLTQCLTEDPANLIFLQHFLGNLAQKYGNNKKGARFAALKTKTSRMTLNKAVGKGQWREAFTAACDALKSNPWDTGTLLDVADAYKQIGSDECELYALRWALDAAPKDVTVNRRAAETLSRRGQFDQAIACWRRVEQSRPGDEEAAKAIAQLSVEKTIQQGGYDQEILHGAADPSAMEISMRERSGLARAEAANARTTANKPDSGREQPLLDAISAQPAELGNYVELAELFTVQGRWREAEEILVRALAASGGGDLAIRERLEEAHLRRAHQQVLVAQRRAEQDKSTESADLAKRMAAQANQAELEVYAARSARNPGNLLLQYELGLRCKRAGKFREAIQAFQAAREDARHKALVQLHLGECFQHIRQFRLALSSYEAAIEAADSMQLDTRKLAYYRAGVLAADLGDRDKAEKYLTQLAAIDFAYRDVADRLDKLAALRDSV
jgi:tetratricopeptide (TPR) repeat protein